eukprot:1161071-Pelagomonas_calceolata.AAC.2
MLLKQRTGSKDNTRRGARIKQHRHAPSRSQAPRSDRLLKFSKPCQAGNLMCFNTWAGNKEATYAPGAQGHLAAYSLVRNPYYDITSLTSTAAWAHWAK